MSERFITDSYPIAVLGGGPAGSMAAATLASVGRRVVLYDEKLAREKPCGGGITHKALARWPFLADSSIQHNWIHECELISSSGRRVSFHLDQPVAVFSRRVLNGLLLERARSAGAEIIRDRVVSLERVENLWQVRALNSSRLTSFVVIASGARNAFRKQLSRPLAPDDLMATAGYYISGHSQLMQIKFLKDLYGYVWIFPRADHFSAGICGRMLDGTTVSLRRRLEESLTELGLGYQGAQFYSHILPSPRASTLKTASVCGNGWALIGDAAGFVDPMTGEGLYYAMRSAALLSEAVLADAPELYPQLLREDFLPELELASEMADRFYSGRWMGEPVIERMVQFVRNSPSFRAMMSDLFAGTQGYLDLRRRLYRTLPAMLAESLATALRLPRDNRTRIDAPSRVA